MEEGHIDIDRWCELDLAGRRAWFVGELERLLDGREEVETVWVEIGPIGHEYDLTGVVETDVGRLRTPLWSHARASVFCDESVHEANRRQLSPAEAAGVAADRLRRRLAVPYELESRGLTFTLEEEAGVERTWTAEHSIFRKRTAVVREDKVQTAGDLDVRDLLVHFYTGPSVRLVGPDGEAFLLPAAPEAEGSLTILCHACRRWSPGSHERCPDCESDAVETVVAVPLHRR
ncbi:MAG: hypothetical protein GEU90_06900 [Gemmatimonas sp.]|nr:hypothetical protein [Gemmatimonas sp.]